MIVAATALLLVIATSCDPPIAGPPPGANPDGLAPNLVVGGFDITWHETSDGMINGYELQVQTNELPWTDIPTIAGAPHAVFTDVSPGVTYHFRVRSATLPGHAESQFSRIESRVYVEPVLPIVRVDTADAQPINDKINYVDATMHIDPNGSQFPSYSGDLRIRGRGNSTWLLPKKPYKVKLDNKSPLMGMASSKDWALLANALDRSQLRTYAAGELSRSTDLAWTPTFRHVELILNGEYMGVFQLAETVKPASKRVDIDELEPEDSSGENLTGGYLVEIDERLEENLEPGWRTPRGVPVVIKEPDPATPEQFSYIGSFVNTFEAALFSNQYADPVNGYAKYLDVDSFIDYWAVQEVTRNTDAFWSSTFFYKKRGDDKLHSGPIWDFDQSLGTTKSVIPSTTDGWYARTKGFWPDRLFTDPAFLQKAADRWAQLEPTFAQLPAQLQTLGAQLRPAIDNDAARWNYALEESDTPQYVADFLSDRINWISNALDTELAG
ncbi:MAG: CotH kinase family protein [Microthrixaceae bacterium]